MSINLTGRFALVTGASRGIGRAVAKAFASAGARVLLAARNKSDLEAVASEIFDESGIAECYPFDLGDLKSIQHMVFDIRRNHGRLDILVANALSLPPTGKINCIADNSLYDYINTNITGNLALLAHCHSLLMKSNAPRVLGVTSKFAGKPMPQSSLYSVGKAGFEMGMRCFAKENEGTELRVRLIDPGPVCTDLQREMTGEERGKTLPQPEDITGVFLRCADPFYIGPHSYHHAQGKDAGPKPLF